MTMKRFVLIVIAVLVVEAWSGVATVSCSGGGGTSSEPAGGGPNPGGSN